MVLGTKLLLEEEFLFGADILYTVPTAAPLSAAQHRWSDYELNTLSQ